MPYHYNTPDDQREMLAAIGAKSLDELFDPIPDDLQLKRPLDLPPALCELELDQHLRSLAARNRHAGQLVCFLGGGSYDHFVPAVCDMVGSRSEFYTSYTPYQAEASQGNLQVIYEYQSLIARLTGMDVANSSLYDGASAAAEAVLMALGAGGSRRKIVLPSTVHPEYRQTIATYVANLDAEIVELPCPAGVVDAQALAAALDDRTAAVVLQQPNFFGCLEDAAVVAAAAQAAGALVIAIFDPISLGLLKRPGDWIAPGSGANIAVAEGHTLGTPMSYGGPFLGILACDQALVRRMPGRIVGETKDRRGRRCFVLTLQTREQHIRRDKATSNVCTNQALFAVRAAAYLAQAGPHGLRETAELCVQKSHYLAERLCASGRFSLAFDAPFFKEFVVRDAEDDVEGLLKTALDHGILAGLTLGRWYPELSDCLLIAVTEKRTKEEMDSLVETLELQAPASRRATPSGSQIA
jgi:glycine dehydrogenase subunit 1